MSLVQQAGVSSLSWPVEQLVALVALGLDVLGRLGPSELFLLLLLVSWGVYAQAMFLQVRWAAAIATGRGRRGIAWLELGSSLPWLLLLLVTWPLRLVWNGLRRLYRQISEWLDRRREEQPPEGGPPDGLEESEQKPDADKGPPPLLVATLGPSFALSALATTGLYLLALLFTPAVAESLALPWSTRGVWERIFLGFRPELGAWPSSGAAPQAAVLLALALWLPVWSTVARLIRLGYGHSLGRNLITERDQPTTLALWRFAFATRGLVAPSEPYRRWAVPMVSCAVIGLGAGWYLLGATGPRPADFAIAWITCLAWVIHLRLRGEERGAVPEPEPELAPESPAGWEDVLANLQERFQVEISNDEIPTREIPPLVPVAGLLAGSPLLAELLPPPAAGMNEMQRVEIARLAQGLAGPPEENAVAGELVLEAPEPLDSDIEGEGGPHRIVLAPEGWGKSTLAFLAAVDQAISRARATLIVLRGPDEVRTFEKMLRSRLEGSALRWNVRCRLLGGDLAADRARGVEPDVLICDLRGLVVDLLGERRSHRELLRRVGLVIVDGAESFSGAVEVHAQLAFRRLRTALGWARGSATEGEACGPTFLVTSRDTMFRTDRWIHTLCGIEASVGRHGPESRVKRETTPVATMAEPLPADSESTLRQVIYRLQELRAANGEGISPEQIVASCERLGVPWHYRLCGAGGRGRDPEPLDLQEHPVWQADREEACVHLLAGAWSEVRRELQLLRRAGADWKGPGSIALITLCDTAEELALAPEGSEVGLGTWLERLPLPILRPPTGPALAEHLAADLVQGWIEVEQLVRIHGPGVGEPLRDLARRGLLLADSRIDVAPSGKELTEQLQVRILQPRDGEVGSELPVRQVELSGSSSTRIVDRSTRLPLLEIDTSAAHLAFYPGRIFRARNGRYVVVETEAWDPRSTHGMGGPEEPRRLWAEPILVSEVSSPRRRIRVRPLPPDPADLVGTDQAFSAEPEPFYFGQYPVAVRLSRAEVSSEHFATLRVDRVSGEVLQKHVVGPGKGRSAAWSLTTEALLFYPEPHEDETPGPLLSLGAARLIAAAMRLVLPSLYRGGGEDLAVGLCLEGDGEVAAESLGSGDAFVFFDLGAGGTGAVRALRRDGLELLLQLVRQALDRLPSHQRLLALHDEWATAENPWGAGLPKNDDPQEMDTEDGTERRRVALAWLDSRLRPEIGYGPGESHS